MQFAIRAFRATGCVALMALSITLLDPGKARAQASQSKFAEVNGVKLHYLIAGKGDPVVLLHGYAETSHMWLPLIAKLSDKHTVIAPDLRGFGQSSAPPDGYTKAAMAQDIHALVKSLKYDQHPAGGSRYRTDGRLCLCGAIPRRSRPARVDGSVPAR